MREAKPTAESVGHDLAVVPAGDNSIIINDNNRKLLVPRTTTVVIIGIVTARAITIKCIVIITYPDSPPTEIRVEVDVNGDGSAEIVVELEIAFLNADQTELCEGCSIDVEAGDCIGGDCDGYDKDATNANLDVTPTVSSPFRSEIMPTYYVRICLQ